jgi:hypothetical protein
MNKDIFYYYQAQQLNCTVTVNSETLGNANLQVLKPWKRH